MFYMFHTNSRINLYVCMCVCVCIYYFKVFWLRDLVTIKFFDFFKSFSLHMILKNYKILPLSYFDLFLVGILCWLHCIGGDRL